MTPKNKTRVTIFLTPDTTKKLKKLLAEVDLPMSDYFEFLIRDLYKQSKEVTNGN